jgi:5'-3' exonuclease
MKLHLLDGTYELFRHYYGAPSKRAPDGREVGAVVGLLRSLHSLLGREEVTHLGCAFDHVIESFRNDLYEGYKTGEGIEPDLASQFDLAEQAVAALGIVVWPMIEFEADDALAAGATRFGGEAQVEQILLCSPDKDLAQCVAGRRVIMWDRRRDREIDEAGVVEKYGVRPRSIPDWLALVGDSADGFPGLPGWGAKSAATVLSRFEHLEDIPSDPQDWGLPERRAAALDATLRERWDEALLFRQLATLRQDVPIVEGLGDLEWKGADESLRPFCRSIGAAEFPDRVQRWRTT